MVSKHLAFSVMLIIFSLCVNLGLTRNEDFDVQNPDLLEHNERHVTGHKQRAKFHAAQRKEEFDVAENHNASSTGADFSADSGVGKKKGHMNALQQRKIDSVGETVKSKRNRKRKRDRREQEEQERGWHHCADGRSPKNVVDLGDEQLEIGHMCRDLYPASTCCYDHDVTMELLGDQILEQIPELQCARMLMKLRCAHCSPRSWWLFHAPDMIRHPHKRVLPIMCPSFCRKFHRICRDSVAGLQADNFCDYHTTNEEGPCFPDSFIRKGTID